MICSRRGLYFHIYRVGVFGVNKLQSFAKRWTGGRRGVVRQVQPTTFIKVVMNSCCNLHRCDPGSANYEIIVPQFGYPWFTIIDHYLSRKMFLKQIAECLYCKTMDGSIAFMHSIVRCTLTAQTYFSEESVEPFVIIIINP